MVSRQNMKTGQRGQITVEVVLIATIIAAVVSLVSQSLRSSSWPGMMVKKPWKKVSSMVESGVWSEKGPEEALKQHPNFNVRRRVSIRGSVDQ